MVVTRRNDPSIIDGTWTPPVVEKATGIAG
jgi:hypothetical protein